MRAAALLRHRGLALAALIAAAAVFSTLRRQRVDYTHDVLPNFDSYVYVAMAENPAVFTAAPWGYRLLQPWLVSTLPARHMVRGFRALAVAGVIASGALLFLFLRRLGHGELPALLGVAALAASAPAADALRVPFLNEPLALMLQMGFLLGLEAGAGVPSLALLLMLGVLTKEHFLLLPPLVFLVLRARVGGTRALQAAVACAMPAILLLLVLRHLWTPDAATPRAPIDVGLLQAGFQVFWEQRDATLRALLLGGIAPLAAAGAWLGRAHSFLPRYGYLAAGMPVASLVAWVNVPSVTPVPLFAENTRRLLIFALPFLIPLALMALDRVFKHMSPAPPSGAPRRSVNRLAAAAIALLLALPAIALDRYRRVELHETRDGPLLRALCQESLRTARRLSRGEAVSFEPEERRFAWGQSDPALAGRMRWFLRRGWGELAHYGTGAISMHAARAELLLPNLGRRDLEIALSLRSPTPRALSVRVNGSAVGSVTSGPDLDAAPVRIPGRLLFRGDNKLTLEAAGDDWRGVKLRRYTLRPAV